MKKRESEKNQPAQSGHFNESELAEIMQFIQDNEAQKEPLARTNGVIDTDKVLNAWSKVRRKSLFGRQ